MRRHVVALTITLLVGLGVARGPIKSASPDRDTTVAPRAGTTVAVTRPYQVGTASWYGEDFVGKPTASGEPYDMYDMTAAHPTLPLGTMVKVTNLRNRRAIVVRINDRGPVVPGRIIDVSYGVARALSFQNQGIQRVRLDVVHPRKAPATMALLREPALGR